MTDAIAQTGGAEGVRWQLTELYESTEDAAIEATLAEGLEFARRFESMYRGRVGSLDAEAFVEMMDRLADYHDRQSRPALYAMLLHSLRTHDPAAGRLVGRIREAGAERGRHMVFFGLELAALSDEQADRLYADPAAARYRHMVEQERRERPHQLSETEERLLTEISPVGTGSWTRLFEELVTAVDVEVDGVRQPLDAALANLREPDRELRRRTSQAVTEALRSDLRTRCYVFNVVLQSKAIFDRLRSYPSWISSRNLANEIDDTAVEALVTAVTSRYDMVARYYRVKRRLLGVEQLFEWDRYAPVAEARRRITWQEARELVVASYHGFSDRAGRLVEDFFDRGWIDAPVEDGKRGGAYCAAATPSLHPYVLMNFTGQLNDALTLAHELGHGLHDRLAVRQHIFDYHPPLTLAETASVFGETLTFERLMAGERDPAVRLAMLCHQLEDAFATIFRQIAFNRFEDAVHNARRRQGELSAEQIGDHFQASLQAMFGDSLSLSDDHRVWWSYVGHFMQAPGYVYAYAFGNLLALAVYQRYREVGPGFVDAYLDFLAAGGSQRPDALVAALGMDVNDPAFWDSGLQILERMVAEVEQLA